jgi:hypothetical protein
VRRHPWHCVKNSEPDDSVDPANDERGQPHRDVKRSLHHNPSKPHASAPHVDHDRSGDRRHRSRKRKRCRRRQRCHARLVCELPVTSFMHSTTFIAGHTAAVVVRRLSPSHVACVGWQRDEQGRPSETTKHSRDALDDEVCKRKGWLAVHRALNRTHTVRVATIVFSDKASSTRSGSACVRRGRAPLPCLYSDAAREPRCSTARVLARAYS